MDNIVWFWSPVFVDETVTAQYELGVETRFMICNLLLIFFWFFLVILLSFSIVQLFNVSMISFQL